MQWETTFDTEQFFIHKSFSSESKIPLNVFVEIFFVLKNDASYSSFCFQTFSIFGFFDNNTLNWKELKCRWYLDLFRMLVMTMLTKGASVSLIMFDFTPVFNSKNCREVWKMIYKMIFYKRTSCFLHDFMFST